MMAWLCGVCACVFMLLRMSAHGDCMRRLRPLDGGETRAGMRERDVGATLTGICAELRAGSGLREALERQAGHAFATSDITVGRMRDVLVGREPARRSGGMLPSERESTVDRAAVQLTWACRLSLATGCAPIRCIEAVKAEYERDCKAQELAQGALAMPKATMRILLGLPLAVIVMGEAMGVRVVEFLLGDARGWIVLGLGFALQMAGMRWTAALVRGFLRTADASAGDAAAMGGTAGRGRGVGRRAALRRRGADGRFG